MIHNPYSPPVDESVIRDRLHTRPHGHPDWFVRLLCLPVIGGLIAAMRISFLVWVPWKPMPAVALLSAMTFASPAWLLVFSRGIAFRANGDSSLKSRLLFAATILVVTWVFVLSIHGSSSAVAGSGIRVASGVLVCATAIFICYHDEANVTWWRQLVVTLVGYLLFTGLPFLTNSVLVSVAGNPVTNLRRVLDLAVMNMVRVFSMGLLVSMLHYRSGSRPDK